MSLAQKNKMTLKQHYYQIILDRITHGKYNPDDILTEKLLAAEFNVSKSPIREALIGLCNEGLMVNIPRYGYEITFFPRELINEILQFRKTLECVFLTNNFKIITSEQIKEMEDLQSKNEKTVLNDASVHWENNTKFHLKLFSFYENQYAYNQLELALRKLGIAYVRKYWEVFHNTNIIVNFEKHRNIIKHLKSGEVKKAVSALETDIMSFTSPEAQNR